MKDRWVRIYGLIDPNTNQLRYVGRTYQEIVYRKQAHVKCAKDGKITPVYQWILELEKEGKSPRIILIDKVRLSEWDDDETFWVGYFKSIGCDLLNTYQIRRKL